MNIILFLKKRMQTRGRYTAPSDTEGYQDSSSPWLFDIQAREEPLSFTNWH